MNKNPELSLGVRRQADKGTPLSLWQLATMSGSQGPDLGPITLCPSLSAGLPLSATKSIAHKAFIFKETDKISGFLFC